MRKLNALKCCNIMFILLLVLVILSFVLLQIIKVEDYLLVKGKFGRVDNVPVFEFNLAEGKTGRIIPGSRVYIKGADAGNILSGVVNKKADKGIEISEGTVMGYIVKLDEAYGKSPTNNQGEYHLILGSYSLFDFVIKQLINTDIQAGFIY